MNVNFLHEVSLGLVTVIIFPITIFLHDYVEIDYVYFLKLVFHITLCIESEYM